MTLKVGMIGLGWFGSFHLDQLLTMDDVEIVALCTANKEKIELAHKKVPHAKCFNHHQEMFDNMDLDAVYVCVTPSRHEDIEIVAATKGIAMYIEKPIGLDIERVREIEKAINQSGVIHSVGYQERYSDGVKIVREWLADETVPIIYGQWIDKMPGALWWRQEKLSGGQVVEQATHIIDMMRFLFGEMEVISGVGIKGMIQKDLYDVVDASNTLLQFDNGMAGSLYCGCYLDESAVSEIGFTLLGRNGKLEYHWGEGISLTENGAFKSYGVFASSHYRSSRTFVDAALQKNQKLILSDYTDARKTLETTLQITQKMSIQDITKDKN